MAGVAMAGGGRRPRDRAGVRRKRGWCGHWKEKKRIREEMVQGPVCNGKGPDCEVKGSEQKKEEKEEGGCKGQGGRRKRARAGIRVWRLGGLGPDLGYSLASQKLFFFCKIICQFNF